MFCVCFLDCLNVLCMFSGLFKCFVYVFCIVYVFYGCFFDCLKVLRMFPGLCKCFIGDFWVV